MEQTGRRILEIAEAAELLGIPTEALRALATSGYLAPAGFDAGDPLFAVSDLKGFQARNSDEPGPFSDDVAGDPHALRAALDGRSAEMARRAFDIFRATFPEAHDWPLEDEMHFVEQARNRFEAILAVTGRGGEVDAALVAELEEVGAEAAWSGSPLPQILVVLRISRDLVVQTAVEVTEEHGRHWGLALSLLLTRVLPAIDGLTDALARGYWAAMLGREGELRERMESLVEHASDGVYEVDLLGRLTFANESFAAIVGRSREQLDGSMLSETLLAAPGEVDALVAEPEPDERSESTVPGLDARRVEIEIVRPDSGRRLLQVTVSPHRSEGAVVGFRGIVRDVTAERELERAKNEFLALVTNDLRSPLSTVLGHGVTLQAYADELSVARLRSMGRSVHRSAERMSRLADDLYDVAQLANDTLSLHLRHVEVREAVEGALASLAEPFDVRVRVPERLDAVADVRRLEQVVANLVENGLRHGEPPVVVDAWPAGEREVCLSVADHGDGVPDALVPTLFSSLLTVSRHDRDRDGGSGLGLFLVKGLVEGMGGRVEYARSSETGGAQFRVYVPTAR